MLLLVGTYRRRQHIETCLASIEQHVRGVTSLRFIDDSGDAAHRDWLSYHGDVIPVADHNAGYPAAMQQVCKTAAFYTDQPAMFVEEDFTFNTAVELDAMAAELFHRPHLAQIALLRQPVYEPEFTHGGVIESLEARGHKFATVFGVIEHTATFTCNPAVWRADVFATGWPQRRSSEEAKRAELVRAGYRFGFLPGIRVHHHGERQGHGY